MRSVIVIILSLLCANSFAAKIDKSAVSWRDSNGSFLGINNQTHQCEIKTDKNRFIIRREVTKFPKSKVSFVWEIDVLPNSKKNLSKESLLDQCTVSIWFSQSVTNTYQIDKIVANVPNRKKLGGKRTENVIVGFGYQVKPCKMLCDDYKYSVDSSVFKVFGKHADLMLNTRIFAIKYKNDMGKLVKVEYDLSELKSVFEIAQEEAKKFNEKIEFKFNAKDN